MALWQLVYTADDGSTFLKSFKTWHADGTEFENAFLPPSAGNICFGVWKEVAHRTVRLHHVGLMFDANGISGTFTVDETTPTVLNHGWPAASARGLWDHPADVRWNWAVSERKKELRSRFQVRHWMATDEPSTWMILNELRSPRPRVEVAVPAWMTSAQWPGIL